MTLALTERQEQLWRYIKSCKRSPSYTEMAMALYGHENAKGRVNQLVCALKERGFVSFIPSRHRSIVALDPSGRVSQPPSLPISLITDAELMVEMYKRGFGVVMLPLHGRIS